MGRSSHTGVLAGGGLSCVPDSEVQPLAVSLLQLEDVAGRKPRPVTFPHQAEQAAVDRRYACREEPHTHTHAHNVTPTSSQLLSTALLLFLSFISIIIFLLLCS